MKRKLVSILLSAVILCQLVAVLPVSAAATSKGSAESIVLGETVRPHLEKGETHWYKIVPESTQYYRFEFSNRSLEVRTGIGLVDSLANFFAGKMSVTIYDQYDTELSVFDIRCGYEGSVSRVLQEGEPYYVSVHSAVSGNYFMTATALADIGGNSWKEATETIATEQIVSAIDAAGDVDWFTFQSDAERAYYKFSLENLGGGTKGFHLYEYVPGAGETPLRDILKFDVNNGSTAAKDIQLKSNVQYYYAITSTSTGTGGYVLNTTLSLDAAGDVQDEAYAIETDTAYISSLDGSGDRDWYSFTTPDYDAYYHLNAQRTSGSGWFSFAFYDAQGNCLAEEKIRNSWASGEYTLNCKLEPNTAYYACLYGDSNTGNYNFTVETKADTYPDAREKAKPIESDKEYSSSFDGDRDKDWACFTTSEYDAYYHLTAWRTSGSGSFDFAFYDAQGNCLAEKRVNNSSPSFEYELSCKLEPDTVYYVYFTGGSSQGNYKFKLDLQADMDKNTKSGATLLEFGKKRESGLEAGDDVDWFKIEVSGEDECRVVLLNESCWGLYCTVYSSRDAKIAELGGYFASNTTSEKTMLLTAGTYYLKVDGQNAGYYTLTVFSKLSGARYGDVDAEGNITTTDARLTLQYAAGKIGGDALDLSAADVDGEGGVTTTDARLILQKAAGKIDSFPVEK